MTGNALRSLRVCDHLQNRNSASDTMPRCVIEHMGWRVRMNQPFLHGCWCCVYCVTFYEHLFALLSICFPQHCDKVPCGLGDGGKFVWTCDLFYRRDCVDLCMMFMLQTVTRTPSARPVSLAAATTAKNTTPAKSVTGPLAQ